MLQCVAVCCSVLQGVAACSNVSSRLNIQGNSGVCVVAFVECCRVLQFVAVCCRVMLCVEVCCSVLKRQLVPQFTTENVCDNGMCVAVCCSVLQCATLCCSVLQCVTVCYSVLQSITVCCSVLQWAQSHDF